MGKLSLFMNAVGIHKVSIKNPCKACFGKGYLTSRKSKPKCSKCKGKGFYITKEIRTLMDR